MPKKNQFLIKNNNNKLIKNTNLKKRNHYLVKASYIIIYN